MDAVCSQNVRLDELVDRHQRVSSGADLIGQGRDAERHAFAGKTLGLAVERLVLPILLEQEHGEEAGPGPSARSHVERCRGLCDLLAVPARKLLANRLDYLPGARAHLERLGDVFAELGEPVPAAGRAGTGGRHHDTLARQVLGERLPCGPLTLEGGDRGGLGCRFLGDEVVLGSIGLELFELELHLIEQAAASFGAGAILFAPQLGDLQLEVGDQRLDGALAGMGVGQLGLCFISLLERGNQQRLERFNVVRKGRDDGFHRPK